MTLLLSLPAFMHNPWIFWGLIVAYAVTILSIIGVVISENRNPLKSLAWITVLMLLPVGGIILYIFFGRSIKNHHMISRRNKRRLLRDDIRMGQGDNISHLSADNRRLATIARSLTGTIYFAENDVELFFNGRDKFNRLIVDLKNAQSYIHLQYYIFEDDHLGTEIAEILKQKAREGVKVRVIYDHIGSIHVKNRFFKEMKQAGVEVYPFFKVAFPPFATRMNWRNHRKIVVIDGRVGYIGGMNIADRYIDGGKSFHSWRDTHMRVTGHSVAGLQYSFAVDWNFMGQPLLKESAGGEPERHHNVGVQLITSGPTSRWSNIAMVFLKAIASASKRIYIQTPYFLPTEALLKALQSAALAHVDVRIMMPRKSDSAVLTYASFSYVSECLRAGIKIYLYDAGMLHSKFIIVDDDWSSIGSTNFDFRSFEHNFEANALIFSTDVNRRLVKQFNEDIKDSTRVKAAGWRHRPIPQRALESIVRLLSPIL